MFNQAFILYIIGNIMFVFTADGFGGTYCWLDYLEDARAAGFCTPRWGTFSAVKAKESGLKERLKDDITIERFRKYYTHHNRHLYA